MFMTNNSKATVGTSVVWLGKDLSLRLGSTTLNTPAHKEEGTNGTHLVTSFFLGIILILQNRTLTFFIN